MKDGFSRRAVIALVIVVTALFLWMISDFLTPIFLAAIFCAMSAPLHRFIDHKLG